VSWFELASSARSLCGVPRKHADWKDSLAKLVACHRVNFKMKGLHVSIDETPWVEVTVKDRRDIDVKIKGNLI